MRFFVEDIIAGELKNEVGKRLRNFVRDIYQHTLVNPSDIANLGYEITEMFRDLSKGSKCRTGLLPVCLLDLMDWGLARREGGTFRLPVQWDDKYKSTIFTIKISKVEE